MFRWIFTAALAALSFDVSAQVPPTAAEVAGFSPLFLAAHSGTASDVEAALAVSGDIDERDANNRTAVHVAAFASNEAALTALQKAGADMNALDGQLYDAVTIAAVADDVEMVRHALKLGNRADLVTSIYDGTALIAAAHLGHAEVVAALIEGGAPLDHVNNLGWTALIEAVVLGDGGARHLATARFLLEAGADPAIGDRQGVTPLEHARLRGFSEMARLIEAYEG